MVQTVFTNSMVAHVWAQRTHDQGRSHNGNFYFYGATIYSYGTHFPIATFVERPRKGTCILFTTNTYGSTTSQHMGMVRQALDSSVVVFDVARVPDRSDLRHEEHVLNFATYRRRQEDLLLKAAHARLYTESHLRAAEAMTAEGNAYADWFGLRQKRIEMPDDLEGLREAARIRVARARVKAARKEKKDAARHKSTSLAHIARWRVGDEWQMLYGTDQYVTDADRAERAVWVEAETAKWLNGDVDRLPGDVKGVRLRRKGDRVQSSMRAECPVAHARLAFAAVARCIRTGTPFVNGDTGEVKLGHFKVSRIDADGTLHAGCHHINPAEITRFATSQGWVTV